MSKRIAIALALAIVLGISWAATAALLWLVCLCFGWDFSILSATGAWIVILVLKNIFSGGKK